MAFFNYTMMKDTTSGTNDATPDGLEDQGTHEGSPRSRQREWLQIWEITSCPFSGHPSTASHQQTAKYRWNGKRVPMGDCNLLPFHPWVFMAAQGCIICRYT